MRHLVTLTFALACAGCAGPGNAVDQQSAVVTVAGDSIVAFRYSGQSDRFDKDQASIPLYLRTPPPSRRIDWLSTEEGAPRNSRIQVLGIDDHGIIRIDADRLGVHFFPFRDVVLHTSLGWSQIRRVPNSWRSSGSFYLIHRTDPVPDPDSAGRQRVIEQSLIEDGIVRSLHTIRRPSGGSVWSLELADLDNDSVEELLTSGGPLGIPESGYNNSIDIYKIDSGGQLRLWLKIPYSRTLDDLKVGDLDADGSPEIVQVGNHRRIIVYERAVSAEGTIDFVQAWESENLGAFTQGLAVADISPVPGDEIVVATIFIRGTNPASGQLVAYEADRDSSGALQFQRVMDVPAQPSLIHGLAVDDITGDGKPEIVLNGRIVYWLDPSTRPWEIARVDTVSLADEQTKPDDLFLEQGRATVVSSFPNGALDYQRQLRWLLTALDVEWKQLPSSGVTRLQGLVRVEIENVWFEADGVRLQLTCSSSGVSIEKPEIIIPALSCGKSYRSEDAFEIMLEEGYTEKVIELVVHRMRGEESTIRYHCQVSIPDTGDLIPPN